MIKSYSTSLKMFWEDLVLSTFKRYSFSGCMNPCISYPWLCERGTLQKNKRIAYQCLLSLERQLFRNPDFAEEFCVQIDEIP